MRSVLCLAIGAACVATAACASDQNHPATAEEVRNGEALPPAPPPVADPAATNSPTAPTVPPPPVKDTQATTPTTATASASAPAKESLSEAQIAKIADLANGGEVDQGKLAESKSKTASVKKFATMMVKHHTEAKNEQAKLFKKLNLTPADSETASTLKADAEKTLATLRDAPAASFDATYAQSQIDAHQKVLDLLDKQLLPSAKTPELTEALKKMKATVESHLAEAKGLLGAK